MRARATGRLLLVLAFAAGGCATSRGFRCPDRGGPPWLELADEHFVLRTDLAEPAASRLLARFERLRAEVLSVLFDGAPVSPGRVEVVAFRSNEEYRAFAPVGVQAYYLPHAKGPPRIVLSAELAGWQRAVLAHELTHHFLAGVFQRQPRWLAEGLAVYMESLHTAIPTNGPTVFGLPSPARLRRARAAQVPAAEILAWTGGNGPRPALDYYAASWLLVHFLAHERTEAFHDLQRRLARGEAPDAALAAALPAFDPRTESGLAALDRALRLHADGDLEPRVRPGPVRATVPTLEQRMPPAEVHALRLALWGIGPAKPASDLHAEIEEALREDPGHPLVLEVKAEAEHLDPLPLSRAAVAAHPDDPRAWTFLGNVLSEPSASAEREDAYRRALKLAPRNPGALHNLARELLAQGRSGEALPLARLAAQLAPWSPQLLDVYAAILSDLGQCAEAIATQRRALDVLPDRPAEEVRRAFQDRLSRYVDQCRPAAGGAGSEAASP
jgi:tetratricopeptide (TPR) repeat protein